VWSVARRLPIYVDVCDWPNIVSRLGPSGHNYILEGLFVNLKSHISTVLFELDNLPPFVNLFDLRRTGHYIASVNRMQTKGSAAGA
jgi:hypothetical protein